MEPLASRMNAAGKMHDALHPAEGATYGVAIEKVGRIGRSDSWDSCRIAPAREPRDLDALRGERLANVGADEPIGPCDQRPSE